MRRPWLAVLLAAAWATPARAENAPMSPRLLAKVQAFLATPEGVQVRADTRSLKAILRLDPEAPLHRDLMGGFAARIDAAAFDAAEPGLGPRIQAIQRDGATLEHARRAWDRRMLEMHEEIVQGRATPKSLRAAAAQFRAASGLHFPLTLRMLRAEKAAERLADELAARAPRPQPVAVAPAPPGLPPLPRINATERRILEGVILRFKYKEISSVLGISEQSVKERLKRFFAYFDVHGREDLAAWLLRYPEFSGKNSLTAQGPVGLLSEKQ